MIVVDMESSGLDPHTDSLLSVGAVEFENPKNQFYEECRLFDGGHVDPTALLVNGFTEEQIHDTRKQTERELIENFIVWTKTCIDRTLAGQNPSTDRDFLRAAAHRAHLDWPFAYRTIDLHSVAYADAVRRKIPIPKKLDHSGFSLDKILVYCGMPEEPKPHNGLRGALLEAEAFSRILYTTVLFDEYRQYPIPWV